MPNRDYSPRYGAFGTYSGRTDVGPTFVVSLSNHSGSEQSSDNRKTLGLTYAGFLPMAMLALMAGPPSPE